MVSQFLPRQQISVALHFGLPDPGRKKSAKIMENSHKIIKMSYLKKKMLHLCLMRMYTINACNFYNTLNKKQNYKLQYKKYFLVKHTDFCNIFKVLIQKIFEINYPKSLELRNSKSNS